MQMSVMRLRKIVTKCGATGPTEFPQLSERFQNIIFSIISNFPNKNISQPG
jgi:hypothetical protein